MSTRACALILNKLFEAFEIADDLSRFRPPFVEQFTALRNEIVNSSEFKREQEAMGAFDRVVNADAGGLDNRRIEQILAAIGALEKDYAETAGLRPQRT